MSKKKRKQDPPLEFPSRGGDAENDPIVDETVAHETLNTKGNSAVTDHITEVITSEVTGESKASTKHPL